LIAVMAAHELTTANFGAGVSGRSGEWFAAMRTADSFASVTTTTHHRTTSLVTNQLLRLEAANFSGVISTRTSRGALDGAAITGRVVTEFFTFVQTTRQDFSTSIFTSRNSVSTRDTLGDISGKIGLSTRASCVGGRVSWARRTSMSTSERLVAGKITLAVSATEILGTDLFTTEFIAATRHFLVHSSAVARILDANFTRRAFSVVALLLTMMESTVEKFAADVVTS
jgi:hypothetical protein